MRALRVLEALETVRLQPAPTDYEPILRDDCMSFKPDPEPIGYKWIWKDEDLGEQLVISVIFRDKAYIGSRTRLWVWLEDIYIKGLNRSWGGRLFTLDFESTSPDGPLNPIDGLVEALKAALTMCPAST